MARRKGPLDAVQFTRESAERIAGVVRQAELTPPAASPLTFQRIPSASVPSQLRFARYTATTSWTKNTQRQIYLAVQNTTGIVASGDTAMAVNRFAIIPGFTGSGTSTTQGVLLTVQRIGTLLTVVDVES
jgi:hypothetical protein